MAQIIVDGAETLSAVAKKRALERGTNRNLSEETAEIEPERYRVYIHSVARKGFNQSNGNSVHHALIPLVELPGCENGERYVTWNFPIRHRFPQRVEDVFNIGRDPFDYHSAERIAQDICDPSNPTLNQDVVDYGAQDPYFAVQRGTNIARHGVFWSRNQVPTETELARAEKKRDAYYRFLINEADKFFAADPRTAITKIETDHRIALDHFGESRDWHRKSVPVKACPNCGTQIPHSAGFHFMGNGACCVNDWQVAVKAGVKTREDVPREARWWATPGRKPGSSVQEDSPESEA